MLSEVAGPLGKSPLVYICEPTLLVEAVANGLVQIGVEMTACPVECAHCGLEGEMGALLSFGQTPGIVLHCPSCENVIMRIVQTPEAYYLDARGAAYLRLERFPNL